MDERGDQEAAASRLLYDDTAPRLRKPITPAVLQFRRPVFLAAPAGVLIASLVAAGFTGLSLGGQDSETALAIGLGYAGFALPAIVIALYFARRKGESFALVAPNLLSVSHTFLLLGFLALAFVPGLGQTRAAETLAGAIPGPQLPSPGLEALKGYCVLFIVVTVASVLASMSLRLVGLRRVVAGGE
ncbi:MAG: hypothetical protein AAGH41_05960 [Pseudomonadota bacterium]